MIGGPERGNIMITNPRACLPAYRDVKRGTMSEE
jgi:hypothetical protein